MDIDTGKIVRFLAAPYRAWVKAYDQSINKIMETEEPHRSILLWDILNEGVTNGD